jgi:hypothetical protein
MTAAATGHGPTISNLVEQDAVRVSSYCPLNPAIVATLGTGGTEIAAYARKGLAPRGDIPVNTAQRALSQQQHLSPPRGKNWEESLVHSTQEPSVLESVEHTVGTDHPSTVMPSPQARSSLTEHWFLT